MNPTRHQYTAHIQTLLTPPQPVIPDDLTDNLAALDDLVTYLRTIPCTTPTFLAQRRAFQSAITLLTNYTHLTCNLLTTDVLTLTTARLAELDTPAPPTPDWPNLYPQLLDLINTLAIFAIRQPATYLTAGYAYLNSAWDGNKTTLDPAQDNAIAPDKQPYTPDGTESNYAHYTNYSRGINCLFLDFDQLPTCPTTDDLILTTGNNNAPDNWSTRSPPAEIAIRQITTPAPATRLSLRWPDWAPDNPDSATEKKWIRLRINPTLNIPTTRPIDLYFGNSVADCDYSNLNGYNTVTTTDEIAIRSNPKTPPFTWAALDDKYDINRDKAVNTTDQLIARYNQTTVFNCHRDLTIPAPPPQTLPYPLHAATTLIALLLQFSRDTNT